MLKTPCVMRHAAQRAAMTTEGSVDTAVVVHHPVAPITSSHFVQMAFTSNNET